MNLGVISNNTPSNTNNVFIQSMRFTGPSANFTNSITISPQYGYSSHYIMIDSSEPSASTPYNTSIFLDTSFLPGYLITFDINNPNNLTSNGASLYLSIINNKTNQILYISPHSGLSEKTIVQFIFDGTNWKRINSSHEAGIDNYLVARVISVGQNYQIPMNASTLFNSGTASIADSGLSATVAANPTVANSAATIRNLGPIHGVTSGTRYFANRFFGGTWAASAIIAPNLWGATATSRLRFGFYQAWQNTNTASSGATAGESTSSSIGFEIQNNGSWWAFRYEGSTPSWQLTSLNYTQSDLGGGQGGQMHHIALYYSPNGIAEWYINKILRLRLTGLSFNFTSFQNYPTCQISAVTGATASTTNVTLSMSAERVYFYQP